MVIKIIKTSYLATALVYIFSIASAEISFDKIDTVKIWNTIQNENIQIRWTYYGGYPICQTTSLLPFSLESMGHVKSHVKQSHFQVSKYCCILCNKYNMRKWSLCNLIFLNEEFMGKNKIQTTRASISKY